MATKSSIHIKPCNIASNIDVAMPVSFIFDFCNAYDSSALAAISVCCSALLVQMANRRLKKPSHVLNSSMFTPSVI
mgnify:CR=1 FL=1